MEATEKTKKIVVTCLTAAQVLHETLDELTQTNFYKHSLKLACNNFERELTKTCDHHIDMLYGDEKSARAVHEGIEQIAKALATMDPYDIVILGDLIKTGKIKYTEDGNEREIKIAESEVA